MVLRPKQLGLALGCFLAIVHLIWALCVALIRQPMQNFLEWIFELHFLQPVYVLTAFNFLDMILLVIVTFIFGYIFGWLMASLWNKFGVKK